MTNTAEKILVMQAFEDGETVGKKYPGGGGFVGWLSPKREPEWDWLDYEYFIKPEAMELWVNVQPGISVFLAYTDEDTARLAQAPVLFRQVMKEENNDS